MGSKPKTDNFQSKLKEWSIERLISKSWNIAQPSWKRILLHKLIINTIFLELLLSITFVPNFMILIKELHGNKSVQNNPQIAFRQISTRREMSRRILYLKITRFCYTTLRNDNYEKIISLGFSRKILYIPCRGYQFSGRYPLEFPPKFFL